eukprot:1028007_1
MENADPNDHEHQSVLKAIAVNNGYSISEEVLTSFLNAEDNATSTSHTMDSIQRVGIDKKIKLLYQLTRDIGDKLHKKESKQEDIFIQFAHHLFDGTRYATDGTIPPNVIHGLGDVFRRYGHHL